MLKSIIEQKNIYAFLRLQIQTRSIPVRSNSESNPPLQPPLQQLDLVARPAGAFVSAAQNRNALPFR